MIANSTSGKQQVWVERLALAGLLCAYLYRTTRSAVDPDIWHEMALAREAWMLGYVPWADSFSFSSTVYPVVHHEWGAGVIAYAFFSCCGLSGLVVWRYVLTIGLAIVAWMVSRRMSGGSPICFFLALPAILMVDRGFSPIRAQMVSFVLTALLIGFLYLPNVSRGRRIYLWLPIHVLWLNIHAGFLVGCGLYFLAFCERLLRREPVKHMLVAGVCMAGLIVVNPYLWHYYGYLFHAVRLPRPLIGEWQPVWMTPLVSQCLFYTSLVVAVYAIVRGRSRVGLLLLVATVVQAVRHERMLIFFVIVWFIYLPLWLSGTRLGREMESAWHRRQAFALVFSGVVSILFAAMWLRSDPFRLNLPSERTAANELVVYPVQALEFLEAFAPKGRELRLVVPFELGAYISWRCWPEVLVSCDSRYEVAYPPEHIDENYDLYFARVNWTQILARLECDAIVVPKHYPLFRRIQGIEKWQKTYEDHSLGIFVPVLSDR